MVKIALDLQKGDIIQNKYEVVWISKLETKDKTCWFDVREKGGCVKKVTCPPGTTFNVKEKK